MTDLVSKYDRVLQDYNNLIVSRFDENDFKLYNEILFSATTKC